MNVIEFRLCDEDRARLDDIIKGLAALVPSGTMSDAAEATAGLAAEHPADAPITHLDPPAPATDPDPAPEEKPISLAEFQKAFTLRCAESPATKAKVRDLIHKYAESVSAIPENKRAEALAELAKL